MFLCESQLGRERFLCTDIVRTELNYMQRTVFLLYYALNFSTVVFWVPKPVLVFWSLSSSLTSLAALWTASTLYIGFHMIWASGR